jgi:hypothetical protein
VHQAPTQNSFVLERNRDVVSLLVPHNIDLIQPTAKRVGACIGTLWEYPVAAASTSQENNFVEAACWLLWWIAVVIP